MLNYRPLGMGLAQRQVEHAREVRRAAVAALQGVQAQPQTVPSLPGPANTAAPSSSPLPAIPCATVDTSSETCRKFLNEAVSRDKRGAEAREILAGLHSASDERNKNHRGSRNRAVPLNGNRRQRP